MGVAYGSSLPACGACGGEGASPAAGATARTQETSGHPHVGCPSGTTSLKKETGPPEHRVARCASSGPVTAAAKKQLALQREAVSAPPLPGIDYNHPLSGWWGRLTGTAGWPQADLNPLCATPSRHKHSRANLAIIPACLPAVPVRRIPCGSKPRGPHAIPPRITPLYIFRAGSY